MGSRRRTVRFPFALVQVICQVSWRIGLVYNDTYERAFAPSLSLLTFLVGLRIIPRQMKTRKKPETAQPPKQAAAPPSSIGTMGERSLHAGLKQWYADACDRFEVTVDGFMVDIVRGELLIEIQTRSFGAIRRKLADLAERHKVRLVHPIAVEKWIIRLDAGGQHVVSRRRSPKKGRIENLFDELVSMPALAANPNLSIEVLLTREEELRRQDCSAGRRRRRRRGGWTVCDRRLIEVVSRVKLHRLDDYRRFLPDSLPNPFTTADLASAGGYARGTAGKVAYCLRAMGLIVQTGKRRNFILYSPTALTC